MTAPLKFGQPGKTARPGGKRPAGNPNRNTINNHSSHTNPHNQGKGSGGGGLGQLSGGHGGTGMSATGSFSYAAQAAQLQQSYFAQLAQIRAQKGFVMGQFRTDLAAAKTNRIAGAVGVEGIALDRGIVGSSGDLAARSGVVAQAATEKAAAISTRGQGLLGLQQQRIDAQNTYQTGLFSVQAQRQAAEMAAQNQILQSNLANQLMTSQYAMTPGPDFDVMSWLQETYPGMFPPPGGGGGGGGGKNKPFQPGQGHHSIQDVQGIGWWG